MRRRHQIATRKANLENLVRVRKANANRVHQNYWYFLTDSFFYNDAFFVGTKTIFERKPT